MFADQRHESARAEVLSLDTAFGLYDPNEILMFLIDADRYYEPAANF